jgi:hypothetical protein
MIMMRYSSWRSWRCFCLTALFCGAALSVGQLRSQNAAPRVGTGGELLTIDREWDKDGKEDAKQFEDMRKGDETANPAILDSGAKWFAYRLTNPLYQEPTGGGKSMHELVKQAQLQILNPYDTRRQLNANQVQFADEFGKLFVKRLEEVSRNRKDIARVNAAMLLAQLAATGVEDAADVLVDIIGDPSENEAVKLFAFRGLKDIFSLGRADNTSAFKKKDREAKCAQALLDYVNRKLTLHPGADAKEIAAINYVRSEALAALGQTRFPAVSKVVAKKVTIERPTALAMLRVVRKDGAAFPPNLGEQVSAAVAICQLKSNLCEEYQPDYVAYQLGQFIVDFSNRYNTEDRTVVEKAEKGAEKATAKTVRHEPWKKYAALLHQAFTEMKEDTAKYPEKDYIAKLLSRAQVELETIIVGTSLPDPQKLASYLEANPPKHDSVYKDLAAAKITSQPEKQSQ